MRFTNVPLRSLEDERRFHLIRSSWLRIWMATFECQYKSKQANEKFLSPLSSSVPAPSVWALPAGSSEQWSFNLKAAGSLKVIQYNKEGIAVTVVGFAVWSTTTFLYYIILTILGRLGMVEVDCWTLNFVALRFYQHTCLGFWLGSWVIGSRKLETSLTLRNNWVNWEPVSITQYLPELESRRLLNSFR